MLVTDTYHRRCAVTGEKALPVLDAAHIRGVAEGGQHRLDNGLLLRSDVYRLFDFPPPDPSTPLRCAREDKTRGIRTPAYWAVMLRGQGGRGTIASARKTRAPLETSPRAPKVQS